MPADGLDHSADVDVVLGMEILSQFDVKIDFKNQVASPEREPCTR